MHIRDIEDKFVSIINDSIKPGIDLAAKSVDWDSQFDTSKDAPTSAFIEQAVTTLFSVIKILF